MSNPSDLAGKATRPLLIQLPRFDGSCEKGTPSELRSGVGLPHSSIVPMEPLKESRRAEGGTRSGRRAGACHLARVNAAARKAAHTQFTALLHNADIEALVRIRLRMPRCLPNFLQSLTRTGRNSRPK